MIPQCDSSLEICFAASVVIFKSKIENMLKNRIIFIVSCVMKFNANSELTTKIKYHQYTNTEL